MSDSNQQSPSSPHEPLPGESEYHTNVAVHLILTIVTCGLFNLYWNYKQMQACNHMLGRQEFSFGLWFLLTIITCGIYHVFYQYKMGMAIVELQRSRNRHVFGELPILSVIVTVMALSIIVDAIHQLEINKIVDPTRL